jgi:hypothetical protein
MLPQIRDFWGHRNAWAAFAGIADIVHWQGERKSMMERTTPGTSVRANIIVSKFEDSVRFR